MNNHVRVFAMLLFFISAAALSADRNRDTKIDLVKIATRYIESYTAIDHKAEDMDGVFIEDVVIPSIMAVTVSYNGKIPTGARNELYHFLVAGKSMASEELSEVTSTIYLAEPKKFCADLSKLSASDRSVLIRQARDGLLLDRRKPGKTMCV